MTNINPAGLGFLFLFLICSSHQNAFAEDIPDGKTPFIIRPGFLGSQDRNQGYTDMLVPLQEDSDHLIFLNPKIVIGDSDDNEQNIGVGYRRFVMDHSAIAGVNFFYDTRHSPHGNQFHQVGLGGEWLSQWFDARLNGYFSLSDEATVSNAPIYSFSGTQVLLHNGQLVEEPLPGLDYEVGVMIPKVSDVIETRVFTGGYSYFSDIGKDINGFRGRVEMYPNKNITLQFQAKDDNTIGTDYFVGGYFTIAFDQTLNIKQWFRDLFHLRKGPRSIKERISQPVVRDIDIVSPTRRENGSTVTEVNKIIHVDNSNSSGLEDGSVDHPYNTLTEGLAAMTAGAGDWLYVAAGDGTATGLSGNFTLVNSVVLWGSGYQAFAGLGGGTAPLINAGGSGTAITLAQNNTVEGLTIQNAATGIGGTGSLGTTVIRSNTINSFGGGVGDRLGIDVISTGAGTHNVTIADNFISGLTSTGLGFSFGMRVRSENTSNFTATVTGNTVRDISSAFQSDGINVSSADTSTMNFSMSRNRIINAAGGAGAHAGVFLNHAGGGSTLNADLGGGTLGATGYNSFSGNATDINASGISVKAENNYFGGGAGAFLGTVDGTPFLTSKPN